MLSIRRFTSVSAFAMLALGAAPAFAQTQTTRPDGSAPTQPTVQPAPPQTPPYSKDLTGEDDTPAAKTVKVDVQPSPPPATVIAPQPVVTVPQPVVVDQRPVNVIETRSEVGLAVSLGGGIGEFTDSTLRDRTGVNGAYDARLLMGTRSPIAAEVAYVGTAGSIDALGLDDSAVLMSNGVEGLMRLNLGNRVIQPFAVGGASWVHYSIVNSNHNTSDVRDQDDVFAVPVGAGIASYFGDAGFMGDLRFVYRFTFNDDLIRPSPIASTGASMANWNVSARIGYAF